jgi:DNA-binding NarL/FixJ family response regulator
MKDHIDWEMTDYISREVVSERRPGRIFIVEDTFLVSLHLQNILSSSGYQITGTANAGADAIEKITKLKPDLVLLDVRLADDVDGIQVGTIAKIRLSIPIVYISVADDEDTINRMLASQPDGIVQKPFEDFDVLQTVHSVFRNID